MSGTKSVFGIAALGLMAALASSACGDDQLDVVVLVAPADAIDTNRDRVVSVTEWDAVFTVWDVNGDGKLDATEFRFNDAAFVSVDVDGNGFVTAAEWNATFAVWDVNADGFLDFSEFEPFI